MRVPVRPNQRLQGRCIAAEDGETQIIAVLYLGAVRDFAELIFQGKTERSLPSKESKKEAEDGGQHITLSHNHWLTKETMERYAA